jgi:hypothetical protein
MKADFRIWNYYLQPLGFQIAELSSADWMGTKLVKSVSYDYQLMKIGSVFESYIWIFFQLNRNGGFVETIFFRYLDTDQISQFHGLFLSLFT